MQPANDSLLYLSGDEVRACLQDLDPVAIIEQALALHARKQIILPDEAYLPWTNSQDEFARSLNMPACLYGTFGMAGTKIINSNPSNIQRNLPRADGVTLLFDQETARIVCIMEGSFISALRTACVSMVSIELLRAPLVESLAVIGTGVLAKAHIELVVQRLTGLQNIAVYDLDQQRAENFVDTLRPHLPSSINIQVAPSAETAIRPAQIIIPTTTTNTGYIPYVWLQPGALLVNVSLDDPLPDVFIHADKIVIDDWNLIVSDDRRILGKLYRAGTIGAPDLALEQQVSHSNVVHGSLGEIILGQKAGRQNPEEIIVVNPFGLALEDIAIATRIYQKAREDQRGMTLPR